MKNVKPISSLRVIDVVNGELFIDGVPAGLPTYQDLASKQNEILFITLTERSGTLSESVLGLLNNINRLTYENVIYYFSLKEGNIKKYFSRAENVTLNEIDVNMRTGEYQMMSSINQVLQAHIENHEIHVSQSDRARWDNKVSATSVPMTDIDYKLILSTD